MDTEERYEVIEELHGEGGFGRVAKRRDKLLDRLVAVKQLKLLDEESMERFRREAKALAKMSHPHIPAITTCASLKVGWRFTLHSLMARLSGKS